MYSSSPEIKYTYTPVFKYVQILKIKVLQYSKIEVNPVLYCRRCQLLPALLLVRGLVRVRRAGDGGDQCEEREYRAQGELYQEAEVLHQSLHLPEQ